MKTSPPFFGSHLHACCVCLCILRLSLQPNLMSNKAAAPFYFRTRQKGALVQQAGRACDDCDPIKTCLPARAGLDCCCSPGLWALGKTKGKARKHRECCNWSIFCCFIALNPACFCRCIKKMRYEICRTWGPGKKLAILWQNTPGNMCCCCFLWLENNIVMQVV